MILPTPSGMLCNVMAENIKILLLVLFILFFFNNLFNNRSAKTMKRPPNKNPIETINQESIFWLLAESIAGFNNEKKLAEIMIPAPKDKKQSNIFFETFLNNKTVQDPKKFIK